MRKIFLTSIFVFVSFVSNAVFATELTPVGLTVDKHFSPYAGSEAMFTVWRGYQRLDDAVLPSSADDTSVGMVLGRIVKWGAIEGILASFEMVAQHEIFGHGFRLREFGISAHYQVSPFEGETSFDGARYNQLSLSEQIAVTTGGVEATGVMANQLRKRWHNSSNNCLDSREASLYLLASTDQPFYVMDTKGRDKTHFPAGHDMTQYIVDINQFYQGTVLTSQKLRRKILLDFLDPYLFYSVYSIGNYMVTGNQMWEYPMIPIGEYQYLPATRMALAPYGPEYQLLNFIKTPEHNMVATLRYGNTGGKRSSAIALEVSNLMCSDLLFIDGRVDLWNQPRLFTSTAVTAKEKFGGAASLVARYRIANPLELVGQLGYKTSGFMPGEVLKHSPIIRVGFLASI